MPRALISARYLGDVPNMDTLKPDQIALRALLWNNVTQYLRRVLEGPQVSGGMVIRHITTSILQNRY
jgi:hypothetical protein